MACAPFAHAFSGGISLAVRRQSTRSGTGSNRQKGADGADHFATSS
jgi:hypothetical protein